MADDRKITIEIEAKDYASSVFRSVTSGLNTFAVTANNGIYRANNAGLTVCVLSLSIPQQETEGVLA